MTQPGATPPDLKPSAPSRLEAAAREDIFVAHAYPEQLVDLGEVRLNYATAGDPSLPPLLLIPGQTESWWGYEQPHALHRADPQLYARTVAEWAKPVLADRAEDDDLRAGR